MLLNLGLMKIRLVSASGFFHLQQMHLSSPSLPTGRQAQDGFRNRKIMTGGYLP